MTTTTTKNNNHYETTIRPEPRIVFQQRQRQRQRQQQPNGSSTTSSSPFCSLDTNNIRFPPKRRRRRRKSSTTTKTTTTIKAANLLLRWLLLLQCSNFWASPILILRPDEKGYLAFLLSLPALLKTVVEAGAPPCIVKDAKKNDVMLDDGEGIEYDATLNKVSCLEPYICTKHSMQGCALAQCTASHACTQAVFTSNAGVSCWSSFACHRAQMYDAKQVVCAMDASMLVSSSGEASSSAAASSGEETTHSYIPSPCLQTTVVVSNFLLCYGAYSCAAPRYEDHMTVHVGRKGVVRCEGTQSSTMATTAGGGTFQNSWACHNLLVYVHQKSRACVITNVLDDQRPCAVVCQEPDDCNADSVRFGIMP